MRWIGFVLSAVMAISFVLPWVDSPAVGTWSLYDGLNYIVEATPDVDAWDRLADVWDRLENMPNPAPGVFPEATVKWAIAAFALSFPLAALFAVIGFFGYYSKPMAFLLGGIPVGLAAYAAVGLFRIREQGLLDGLPDNFSDELFTQAQANLGAGMGTYFGAGLFLFLAAVFGPSRR